MGFNERLAFLRKLDSGVWIEKRLFPSRLLVLDEIEGNQKSEHFVIQIMNSLRSTDRDNDYMGKRFVEVAFMAAKRLKIPEPLPTGELPPNTNSALEQFLSDLKIFGLREALAYIFEDPNSVITSDFETFMTDGYYDIGRRFLHNSKLVRKRLEKTNRDFIKNDCKPVPSILDRLILVDVIEFGGPWGDGQPQTNFAASE
jgi:hypothetical protein